MREFCLYFLFLLGNDKSSIHSDIQPRHSPLSIYFIRRWCVFGVLFATVTITGNYIQFSSVIGAGIHTQRSLNVSVFVWGFNSFCSNQKRLVYILRLHFICLVSFNCLLSIWAATKRRENGRWWFYFFVKCIYFFFFAVDENKIKCFLCFWFPLFLFSFIGISILIKFSSLSTF